MAFTLFTTNPNEANTQLTTPSAGAVVSMLLSNWTDLNQNGARTLAAQFMAETGGGKSCFNWNLGNVKSGPDTPHMYLRNVWECDTPAGAATQVANSNSLGHIATAQEIKDHGWDCKGAVVVVFQPPHAQCRFRAYANLQEGAKIWLDRHRKMALSNAEYLKAVNAGDTAAVAHFLRLARYYTAPEANYAAGMASQKKVIDTLLGPIK